MKKITLLSCSLMMVATLFAQDFTLVTLPDIQNMTWAPVNQNLYNEMQYIIDQKTAMNTKFVVSLGDLTADGYTNISPWSQWDIAKQSSDMIVNAGIPYAVCTGNHDMDHVPAYETPTPYTRFNQYYPVSDFTNKSYFGGYYRDMSNGYYLFSASGMDFIIVVLQNLQEASLDPGVVSWANQVLSDHAHRRAIISTHMLYQGDDYMTRIIEKHDNVFMAVYGHHCADNGERHWTTQTPSGNTIHCMMSDYQCRSDEGGGAVIRYYTFKPNENKIYAYTYSTYKHAYETDASSQFSFDYLMQDPEEPQINQVVNVPVYPTSKEETTISATITDNKNITSATLRWSTNKTNLNNETALNRKGDVYSAIIAAHANKSTIYYQISASDGDGHTTTSEIGSYQVEDDVTQLPCPYNTNQNTYQRKVHTLPGKVEAEDFDEGCHGVAFYDTESENQGSLYRNTEVDIEKCEDTGGGYNIGWTKTGEWTSYTVDAEESGIYRFDLRVASQPVSGGKLHLEVNQEDMSGTITVPSTGGWQKWTTVAVNDVPLNQGEQIIKIVVEAGDFNLNYFDADVLAITTDAADDLTKAGRMVFPNPGNGRFQIQGLSCQQMQVDLYDITGRKIDPVITETTTPVLDISAYPNGIYLLTIKMNEGVFSHKLIKQ